MGRLAEPVATSRGPLLVVITATLAIRCLQLFALKVASGAQAATGPSIADGNPRQYFVFTPSPGSPGLGPILANWDGQWYLRIASIGYPRVDQVQSANDAWVSAFPPGFPAAARATMALTGLPFVWAALLLNTVLTLAATVLLYRMLTSAGLGQRASVAAGIGVSLLPASPVLVTAYSEALALALVILALVLIRGHRYLAASLAIVALGFTRPVAIAFVPVVVVHGILRSRTGTERASPWQWAGMVLALVAAALSPWMWPTTAARVLGVPDGTEFIGAARTEEVLSGLRSGYLTNAFAGSGVRGLAVVAAAALLLVGVPVFFALRVSWPLEAVAWGAAYIAMVVIVTPPSPSIVRYLVLAAPLLVVLFAAPVTRPSAPRFAVLLLLVGLCVWSQWLWVVNLFILDPTPRFAP